MSAPKLEILTSLLKSGDVKKELMSLKDAMIAFEIETAKAAEKGTKIRMAANNKETTSKIKNAEKLAKLNKSLSDDLGGGADTGDSLGGKSNVTTPRKQGFFKQLQSESPQFKTVSSTFGKMATMAGAAGLAIGAMAAGIGMATEGLKQFGGFLISDVIKPAFALETLAVQTENASGGQVKAQQIMDVSNGLQERWNIDALEAANSLGEFIDKTGDPKMAMGMMDNLAMISKGFGASMEDLSGLAAAMFKKGMSGNDLRDLMYTQLAQGQSGKITIKEIAKLGGEFTKSSAVMAGDDKVKMASLGAALQTGAITGKAEVSMSNLNAFLSQVSKAKFADKVVVGKNQEGEGIIGDVGNAIRQALIATKGNMSMKAIQGTGLSDSASSFLVQYGQKFQEGLKMYGKDLEKAADYATKDFEDMRKVTTDEMTVKAAANKVMQTSGEKFQTSINAIKAKLMQTVPEVQKFVDVLTDKTPAIADAALTLAEVMIAVAAKLGMLIPESDTRLKRKMQLERTKDYFEKQAAEKEKQAGDIAAEQALDDAKIEKLKGKKDPESQSQLASLMAVKASRAKQIEGLNKQAEEERKKKDTAQGQFDAKVDMGDAYKQLQALSPELLSSLDDSVASSRVGMMNTLNSDSTSREDKRSILQDFKDGGPILAAIKADPTAFDTSSDNFKKLPPELQETLKKLRDQAIDDKEKKQSKEAQERATKAVEDGAKAQQKAAEAMEKLAKSLNKTPAEGD